MLKLIRSQAKKEDWLHALLSIGYYATGSLMPVWLSFLLLGLVSQPIGGDAFLDNGQFAIYAAAALSPILYQLSKKGSGQEGSLYQLLILICLIIAAGIFSGLTVVESVSIGSLDIHVWLLRVASLVIYAIALVATFFLDLYENVYDGVNPVEEQSNRQQRLEDEFDQQYPSL